MTEIATVTDRTRQHRLLSILARIENADPYGRADLIDRRSLALAIRRVCDGGPFWDVVGFKVREGRLWVRLSRDPATPCKVSITYQKRHDPSVCAEYPRPGFCQTDMLNWLASVV